MTALSNVREAELRSLEHDVLHQLSTIGVLAALLDDVRATDIERRLRVRRLCSEIRWLDVLLRVERSALLHNAIPAGQPRSVRLDVAMTNLLVTARMVSRARIHLVVEPVVVSVEHVGLGRALRNLLWNSLEAAGPGGELTVRVRSDGESAMLSLEDNGPGLDEESVPKGTHLGLGVVREVASAAGGKLRLENLDQGCRVTLTLPLVTERRR
jgi:signal transduction histidine kinase